MKKINAGVFSLRAWPEGVFKMSCTSSDPRGTYYGLKVGAYALLGLDTLMMAGTSGVCNISGITGGAQLGGDASLLKAVIR